MNVTITLLDYNLFLHTLQSKLAIKNGGVIKCGKKSKKILKRLALKALDTAPTAEAPGNSPVASTSPSSSSPSSIPDNAEPETAHKGAVEAVDVAGSSSNHSSMSQQADAGLPANPSSNVSQPDRHTSASPLSGMASGDTPEQGSVTDTTPGTGISPLKSATGATIYPEASEAVPSMPSSTPNKRQLTPSALLIPNRDTDLEAGGGMPGLTPSKSTPGKATPNKRPREAVCSSPAANSPVVSADRGLEAGLREGTPGKRRRSLLPQAPQEESTQVWLHSHCAFSNASCGQWCHTTFVALAGLSDHACV